jgi:hypothetical protein
MTKNCDGLDWLELFPEGRYLFYEGKNLKEFVEHCKETYKFDPSENNPSFWDGGGFFCPPEHLNELYSTKYPMGS